MEDSWLYIDDDDNHDASSNSSLVDSDKIDSETEAELYSRLHHEPNLSFINPEDLNEHTSGLLVYSEVFKDDIPCIKKGKNESNCDTNECPLFNKNTDNFFHEKRKSSEMDADCETFNKKLSPAKKHKTELMCQDQCINLDSNDSKNINDTSEFTINNVQNKNTVCISNNILSNKKETSKQESSDSDSDIWIEENSAEKSDLKINVLKETDIVFLSSDSDNEFDTSSPFGKRDSFLRNLSMPNIKSEENPKGLWHINSEDLRRSKKQYHRYHDNFDIVCSNCNKKGHTVRTCPSPRVIKCFICGGNHTSFRCSKRVCSNCHIVGHDRMNCQRDLCKDICHLCSMPGHAKANCPDIWRRYHLTTSPFELKKGKQVQQSKNLYCWNCGQCGHFGAVCQFSYLSRNSLNTLPCVISYTHPKPILKNRLSILKKYSYLSLQKVNRNTNNISNASTKHSDHLRQEYMLNISSRSNEENKGNKKGRKKFRTAFRFDKVPDIVNGKDFPRTSKKSPNKCSSTLIKSEEEAESPHLLIKKQFNIWKKRWNQELRKYGIQACKSVAQNEASRALIEEFPVDFDPNLPESIKIQLKERFQRWRKNRLKHLKKKHNKACKKKESLQNHDLH